jgi:MATE family multidrug resistance protein
VVFLRKAKHLNFFKKYKPHYSANMLLAYPVMISQVGHPLVGFSASVILGHFAGTVPLAALAIANGFFNLMLIIAIGISYGITPLVARENGAANYQECGRLLSHSIIVNVLTGLILLIATWLGGQYLIAHIGLDIAVVAQAKPLLVLLGLSVIPLMLFLSFKQFAEGLGFTRLAMQVSILGNVINIVIGIILVKGLFGLPAMGAKSIGYSAIIDRGLMAIVMAAFVLKNQQFNKFLQGCRPFQFSAGRFKKIMATSVPIVLQNIFEISAFSAAVFMVGIIGARQLAAYQIAMNFISFIYYAANGLGTAAAIQTGYFLGQAKFYLLRASALASYHLTILFHLVTGVLLLVLRGVLPKVISADQQVISLVGHLFVIAAGLEVFDGLQVVSLGILRGIGDLKYPVLINLAAYWGVALPVAFLLGLHTPLGLTGVWLGLYSGLLIASALLYLRFRRLAHNRGFAGEKQPALFNNVLQLES